MSFKVEEATYLLGVIAARESKTGKAGLVGGINVPSIASSFLAFKAGAHSVNPKFEVKRDLHRQLRRPRRREVATLSLINAGCDFIFHQANEAGRGVFQACSERKIRCFGANKNQTELAPDVVVASAVVDVAGAYAEMARIVKEGRFKPEVQHFGMNDGTIRLEWNDALKAQITPATVAEVEKLTGDIKSGASKPPLWIAVVLRLSHIVKSFGATRAVDRRFLRGARRRDRRARRRERRGQDHADAHCRGRDRRRTAAQSKDRARSSSCISTSCSSPN